jgi:hypothetical protein
MLISFVKKIREFLRWLFYEPRIFWINIFAFGICFAGSWLFRFSELSIRIIGMFTQLLGAWTVIRSIDSTAKTFGLPGLFKSMQSWFSRMPRLRRGTTVHLRSAGFSDAFGGSAHAIVTSNASANDPIEKRVESLERNVKTLFDEVSYHASNLGKRVDQVTQDLQMERTTRIQEITDLNIRNKEAQTGGLHISRIGAFWAVIGIVLTSLPVEIANRLQALFGIAP